MLLVTCVSWDLESTCLHYCMFVLHISIHQCSVMHMTHVPSAPPSLPGSSKHCCMMGLGMRHSPPMRSGLLWICCLVELVVSLCHPYRPHWCGLHVKGMWSVWRCSWRREQKSMCRTRWVLLEMSSLSVCDKATFKKMTLESELCPHVLCVCVSVYCPTQSKI